MKIEFPRLFYCGNFNLLCENYVCFFFNSRPPRWPSGQHVWLLMNRLQVRFPVVLKGRLGLQRGPPSLVRYLGSYLTEKCQICLRKSTLPERNAANHIIPLCCFTSQWQKFRWPVWVSCFNLWVIFQSSFMMSDFHFQSFCGNVFVIKMPMMSTIWVI